jgi:hypothetical protein
MQARQHGLTQGMAMEDQPSFVKTGNKNMPDEIKIFVHKGESSSSMQETVKNNNTAGIVQMRQKNA